MSLSRIYAVYLRYFYIVKGNPQRFFNIFIWAIMDIVLWGFITKYLNTVGNAGLSFTPLLLGAVILWAFLVRVQQGVSTPALEDTWAHNHLNYFASPLKVAEYTLGLVLSSVLTSAIGLFFVIILAGIFFGLNIFILGVMLAPFLGILFLFGIALGVFAIGVILRYGPSAEWLIWPIPALIEPFCGVLYPISVLPQWMQAVSRIFPPTYVFQGMRAILEGGQFSYGALVVGTVIALVWLLVAAMFFARIFRYAVKHGLIVRFSAEGA
jgi:ABC-2 type transport system permease protein